MHVSFRRRIYFIPELHIKQYFNQMKKLMIRNDQRLSVEGRGKWQNRLFRVFSLLMVAVFGSSALWAQLTNLEVGKV